GVAPYRRAIVQWRGVPRFADGSRKARIDAEVIFYETTNQIQMLYGHSRAGDADAFAQTGGSATIGIEDGDGLEGVEIAADVAGAAAPGRVHLLSPEGPGYVLEGWESVDGNFENIASTGTVVANLT